MIFKLAAFWLQNSDTPQISHTKSAFRAARNTGKHHFTRDIFFLKSVKVNVL